MKQLTKSMENWILYWTSWTENYTGWKGQKCCTFRKENSCKLTCANQKTSTWILQHILGRALQTRTTQTNTCMQLCEKCANTETTQNPETHAAEKCFEESAVHDCREKSTILGRCIAFVYLFVAGFVNAARVFLMCRRCCLVCMCFLKLQRFVLIGHCTEKQMDADTSSSTWTTDAAPINLSSRLRGSCNTVWTKEI